MSDQKVNQEGPEKSNELDDGDLESVGGGMVVIDPIEWPIPRDPMPHPRPFPGPMPDPIPQPWPMPDPGPYPWKTE